jgi:hypothetical protein
LNRIKRFTPFGWNNLQRRLQLLQTSLAGWHLTRVRFHLLS